MPSMCTPKVYMKIWCGRDHAEVGVRTFIPHFGGQIDLTFHADKDRASGRVTAVWPGSSIHYMDTIETPRWEDFEISYYNVRRSALKCLSGPNTNVAQNNPFAFMGNGVSQREANSQDLSYCRLASTPLRGASVTDCS